MRAEFLLIILILGKHTKSSIYDILNLYFILCSPLNILLIFHLPELDKVQNSPPEIFVRAVS